MNSLPKRAKHTRNDDNIDLSVNAAMAVAPVALV